jgi:hypothetical protein
MRLLRSLRSPSDELSPKEVNRGGKRKGPVPPIEERGLAAITSIRSSQSPDLGETAPTKSKAKFLINVWLSSPTSPTPINTVALVDSGADSNFLDQSFAAKHHIPRTKKESPIKFSGFDGCPISTKIVEESNLTLSCKNPDSTYHTEPSCHFEIIQSPKYNIILGFPWLQLHQPSIQWEVPSLHFKSDCSKNHCRITKHLPTPNTSDLPWSSTNIKSALPADPNQSSDLPWSSTNIKSALPADPNQSSDLPWSSTNIKSALPADSNQSSDLPWSSTNIKSALPADPNQSSDLPWSSINAKSALPAKPTNHQLPPQFAEFSDVFKEENSKKLPPHRAADCAINLLPNKDPPFGPIYPLSPDEDKLTREYLEEYQRIGFIRKSTSSAGSPIFFVDKEKNIKTPGKVPQKRLVVNYQMLDKGTEKFRYPMPLINDLFDHLKSATIFTKIDLRSAYHLLRIREGDEWKTAFRTKYGLFEYLVMPFGLANAPAYFQRFVSEIFGDMFGKFVVIYLDDFLIYSENPEDHDNHVRAVLQRLRENRLYAKLEKCQFSVPTVKFLGFNISANGMRSDEDKVKSIVEWPVPTTKRELLVFLGVTNYQRKFVDGFSKICYPLHRLCRKKVAFSWTQECQTAFETLKAAISSTPLLIHPDPQQPFWVETDASDFALGCVLAQKDSQGDLRPCAYYSRSLIPAERNYCIYDKELLAIKVAFEEWRHYLEGAPHKITVLSDHKGLEFLANNKVMNQRHARWSDFFKRFDFLIRYRPGTKNNQADALSRRPDYEPSEAELKEISNQPILDPSVFQILALNREDSEPFADRVKVALTEDTYYQSCLTSKKDPFTFINDTPYYQDRMYIPEGPLRLEVLRSCHDTKLAGHYGRRKTTELVTRKFYWPNMNQSIQDFCDTCEACTRSKTPRHLPFGKLMPLPISERPWSSISMDFITDLPESEGMTTILTVVDRFSKMGHFIPVPNLLNAEETAEVFIHEIVRLHGLPLEIISDRGTQFTSHFWERFLSLLGIKRCLSSAYHPQSDGQSERANQVIQQYLRCFVGYHQDDWASLLPLAEFSFNNTLNVSTGYTPFFANSGIHPRFEYLDPMEEVVPSVENHLRTINTIQEELKDTLTKALESQEEFANRRREEAPTLVPGDLVWLDSRNISSSRPSKKLDYKRLGPFEVVRSINPVAFELKLPPWMKIHPVFHVSLLEKAKTNQWSSRSQPKPPPIQVEDHEEYLVQEILDSRLNRNRLQYFIDWEGYPPSERCWVNATDVHAPVKVKQFHQRYPLKPHPDGLLRGEEL